MADPPTRISGVELRCSDVKASAEFYRRTVGLQPTSISLDRAELRGPAGGGALLSLVRAERGGRVATGSTGLFHTAFRYPDRAGLAAALERVASAGASVSGVADHGVSEALYLDDPDGMGIELYRDRPPEQWPQPAEGERIAMFTKPLDLAGLRAARSESDGAPNVEIGHVHLKVADPADALAFWTEELGMELMTRFGEDAIFCAFDDYHHHIGANAWFSRDAEPEPDDGPGLAAVSIHAVGGELRTPDGTLIRRVG